jgi:metallo-beta-lactamase class B
MAEIKRLTRARMLMHEGDADLLESGGGQDFRFPEDRGTIYAPINVDRRLKDGEKVRLGEAALTVTSSRPHQGSDQLHVHDRGRRAQVRRGLIVNMPTI